jgi:hypothetical protein
MKPSMGKVAKILAVLNHDATVSLNDSCHSVTLAGKFSEAIRILTTESIDLIIADILVQDDASEYNTIFDLLRWVNVSAKRRFLSYTGGPRLLSSLAVRLAT